MPRRIFVLLSLLLWLSCAVEPPTQPAKNQAPSAVIGGAQASTEGRVIILDGSSSTDPDGDSLTYAWEFGDGVKKTGRGVSHAYQDEGSYQVSLVVADDRGAGDTARATVTIENAPPVISSFVTPPNPVIIGTAATIVVAFSDPGSMDTLIASLDWGDQISSVISAGVVSHTYAAVGKYVVTVTVRDNDGAVTQQTAASPIVIAITPPNLPPMARISGPSSGREGATMSFSARGSTDPEDGDSVRYTWLPGDGRKFSVNEPIGWYAEQGWGYADNGTYVVSVIVTDRQGAADTASLTLTVVNVLPALSIYPPAQQAIGMPATARFAVSDSGSRDTLTIAIRWGDGTRDSIASGSEPRNNIVTHTYATPGSYWVEATAYDDDGGARTDTAAYAVIVFDASEHKSIAGYDVFDLGTLGGNSAQPQDFNDNGHVVGSSLTASGLPHAFIWENGAIRDLGTAGYPASIASRINNAGLIAGSVGGGECCGDGRTPFSRATLWRNGTSTVLESGRPEYPTLAAAINESGVIAWNAYGHEDPYAWSWSGAGWQRLGALIGPLAMSSGASINERGQIVGSSAAVSTGEHPGPNSHAFIWESGTMRDLGLLGSKPCPHDPGKECGYAQATSINESGQIAGFSTAADGSWHVVLWDGAAIRDLWKVPEDGTYYTTERAVVNDRGQVALSVRGQAFFWSDGALQALGSLGGGSTEIVDMNEAGTVVGTSRTAGGQQHAFVWTHARGMVDLGAGPHDGFTQAWVVGISFGGDIVGYAAPCKLGEYSGGCAYPMQVRAAMWRNVSGNP